MCVSLHFLPYSALPNKKVFLSLSHKTYTLLTDMKTIKNRFIVLLGVLIPMLTANCIDKKSAEKTETTEVAAKTESVIKVNIPTFNKFVEVTAEDASLYKTADTGSPTLVRWDEDCLEGERDEDSSIYLWSDQPGIPDYEKSTDIAYKECIFPVVGEEGDFYKAYIGEDKIESAYILKSNVKEIKSEPVTTDMIYGPNWFRGDNQMVVKDGKYKDIVLFTLGGERTLTGEQLNVGILLNGIVAMPENYYIDCRHQEDQKEPIVFKEEDGNIFIDYNDSLVDKYELDPKKLSEENIAKIIETVNKKKPERTEYIYYFPTSEGLPLYPFHF